MRVVITGGTRGIGLALCRRFLVEGDSVVVTTRSERKVAEMQASLFSDPDVCDRARVMQADVTDFPSLTALVTSAAQWLGGIDMWINNAGINGINVNLVETEPAQIKSVIETNLTGTLLCCRAVLPYMIEKGHGHIFNMDGAGSNGMMTAGYMTYGVSKNAIPYLSKVLGKETKGTGVGIHTISPGMVLTDLLLHDVTPEAVPIFNILAELPSSVADFLVPRIRATKEGSSGTYHKMLTTPKVMWKFLTARSRKGRFFNEEGQYTGTEDIGVL
ncbi:short-chain dehydrogenase/reductase SDR [Kipferlia bialata]|uniref:Short-chain dehydrogenase/reductase SDR n=1 Tax=Kipferlia bialata TaxID=797122 RepID=A0A9K3CS81_9EUKA|nr:short-chain dehydrogenase/reductase SDR [Kipferlia bialata]|eukprot:g3276.t1